MSANVVTYGRAGFWSTVSVGVLGDVSSCIWYIQTPHSWPKFSFAGQTSLTKSSKKSTFQSARFCTDMLPHEPVYTHPAGTACIMESPGSMAVSATRSPRNSQTTAVDGKIMGLSSNQTKRRCRLCVRAGCAVAGGCVAGGPAAWRSVMPG